MHPLRGSSACTVSCWLPRGNSSSRSVNAALVINASDKLDESTTKPWWENLVFFHPRLAASAICDFLMSSIRGNNISDSGGNKCYFIVAVVCVSALFHFLRDKFGPWPPGGPESYELDDSQLQSLRCAEVPCVYLLDVSFLYLGP